MEPITASRRVFDFGISALQQAYSLIESEPFKEATEALSHGRVWTTGMGKASLPAKKLATTLSCNGIASAFIHAGEALHGDFGAIQSGDKVVAFSNSGKTREVIHVARKAANRNAELILITGSDDSPLGNGSISGITLCYGMVEEACPLGLTPTSSILVMLAVADALAMGVQAMVGLTHDVYAENHHDGYLGQISRMKAERDGREMEDHN